MMPNSQQQPSSPQVVLVPPPGSPTPTVSISEKGMIGVVIELVQKLPPAMFAMVIVIGAALLVRMDMKDESARLRATIEKEAQSRAEAARDAHRDAAQQQELNRQSNQRQWESMKDMTREVGAGQKAIENKLTELINETRRGKPPGG